MFQLKSYLLNFVVMVSMLFSAIVPLGATQAEAVAPVTPERSVAGLAQAPLQFQAGDHLAGLSPDKVSLAALDHALNVEFVDTTGVTPQAAASDLSGLKRAALYRVSYPDLWPGISVAYDAAESGIAKTTYQLALDPGNAPQVDLPDLVLDQFTLSPVRPQVGQPVTFTINVRNAGLGNAPGWRVQLYVDPVDRPPTTTTPYSLTQLYAVTFPPGATGQVELPGYVFTQAGCDHVIYAWADPREGIPESDENNNMRVMPLCVDPAPPTVVATVPVGTNPYGVGVNPTTNRIYVANLSGNTVSVIDGANNTVVATVPVGSNPYGVGVNPMTQRVYVSNFYSNTVTVIQDDVAAGPQW